MENLQFPTPLESELSQSDQVECYHQSYADNPCKADGRTESNQWMCTLEIEHQPVTWELNF